MVLTILTSNTYNTVVLNKKLICNKNNETFSNIISDKFENIEKGFKIQPEIIKSGSDLLESLDFTKSVILTESQMLIFTAIFLEYGAQLLENTHSSPIYMSDGTF